MAASRTCDCCSTTTPENQANDWFDVAQKRSVHNPDAIAVEVCSLACLANWATEQVDEE